ncbi:MAG: acyltransferase [Gemmatirosa sp.]|nr:acyltransferase [Gemmatirosa sp.]
MALLLLRQMAMADTPFGRTARSIRRFVLEFSLPAPKVVLRPMLWLFLGLRQTYYFVVRIFVCEPIFKAYCHTFGKRVRTGVYIPWVQGTGRLDVGDDVALHGKVSFIFGARYADEPTLTIGSHTQIGHNVMIAIGRAVSIGEHCLISADVSIFDSSGHPSEPEARLRGEPSPLDQVKPVTIERNVWIGRGAMVLPGVTIGENSVVAAHALVTQSVPANSFMLGNPARRVGAV